MTSLNAISDSLLGKQSFQLVELNRDGSPILGSATVFTADAVISENYSKSLNVTSYPVEDGTDITESARVNNLSYSMTGITSDASMSYFDFVDSVASSSLGQLFGYTSKSQRAYEQLNRWMDAGQPLQLITKFQKYGFKTAENKILPFVIESLSIPRDKSVGKALKYSMSLRSVNIVSISDASLIDVAFGSIDKGAQQLVSNQASNAVASQPANERTISALRDRASQTGPISSILQGL